MYAKVLRKTRWKYLIWTPDQTTEKNTWDSSTTKIREREHQCQPTVFHGKQVSFNFLLVFKKVTDTCREAIPGWGTTIPHTALLGENEHITTAPDNLQNSRGAGWLTGSNGGGTHRSTSGGAPWGPLPDLTLCSILLQWSRKSNYFYWQNLQVTVGQAGNWGGFDDPRQWWWLGS